MLEAFSDGLLASVAWPAIGFLIIGVLVGAAVGAIPGLGATVGLALFLPFTFGMSPVQAFAFLLGLYASLATFDTIPAVLISTPGTPNAQATILDGYPLARKGQAARAMSAAFTASMIGGVFGAFVLALAIPILRPLVLTFRSPELFAMGLFGLATVSLLSEGSMVRGFMAAVFGILLATVGLGPDAVISRFGAGHLYLYDGIGLVPLVVGVFAIPEVIDLAVRRTSIAEATAIGSGRWEGVKDTLRHWPLVIRCSVMGVLVGIMPALGGNMSAWLAYGHAMQSSKHPEEFGKGAIEGVIGPESANNATTGGALIPTIAFGVPGSAPLAILLGAFLIVGLTPGPAMLKENLDVTFSMVWAVVFANLIAGSLCLLLANHLGKLTFLRPHIIIVTILLFVFIGSFAVNADFRDILAMLGFGAFGYLLRRYGWSRPALTLGIVLGPILEDNALLSTQIWGTAWLYRPIVLALFVITIASLFYFPRIVGRAMRRDRADA